MSLPLQIRNKITALKNQISGGHITEDQAADKLAKHLGDNYPSLITEIIKRWCLARLGKKHNPLPEGWTQAGLFPVDRFQITTPLKDLKEYAQSNAELTTRYAKRDHARLAYVEAMIEAVGGDEAATWEQGQAALEAIGWEPSGP